MTTCYVQLDNQDAITNKQCDNIRNKLAIIQEALKGISIEIDCTKLGWDTKARFQSDLLKAKYAFEEMEFSFEPRDESYFEDPVKAIVKASQDFNRTPNGC